MRERHRELHPVLHRERRPVLRPALRRDRRQVQRRVLRLERRQAALHPEVRRQVLLRHRLESRFSRTFKFP